MLYLIFRIYYDWLWSALTVFALYSFYGKSLNASWWQFLTWRIYHGCARWSIDFLRPKKKLKCQNKKSRKPLLFVPSYKTAVLDWDQWAAVVTAWGFPAARSRNLYNDSKKSTLITIFRLLCQIEPSLGD